MKTGPPSEGAEEESKANKESSILIRILERCKNGATKGELINTISLLSHSNLQFRRSTAELVDRRLLNYDEKQHVFITTDKGILFLNSAKPN
jgi:predicted transcriptional regulator